MVARLCIACECFRMHCHSLRDFFLAILLLSTISMTILYELSLPWIQEAEKDFHWPRNRAQDTPRPNRNCYMSKTKDENNDVLGELFNNRTDVLMMVQEIEERILGIQASKHDRNKHVMVQGNRDLMEQELPVYEPALKKYGFVVQVPRWYRGHTSTAKGGSKGKTTQSWDTRPAMLLLMEENVTSLTDNNFQVFYQRVNQIPKYLNHLTPSDNLCRSLRWAKENAVISSSVVSPDCYVIPDHQEELLYTMQNGHKMWRVDSPVGSISRQKISDSWKNSSEVMEMLKHGLVERSVVQQAVTSPLMVTGAMFVLKVYVLVTSVFPLRAYLHSQAIIQIYNVSNSIQQDKTWSMEQWTEHIYEAHGQDAVSQLKHNLHSSVTQTLLLSNHLLVHQSPNPNVSRCFGCFQLFEFDMAFNSTFHAFVLEVTGQPHLEHLPSWSAYATKQQVIQDMVSIVSGQSSVAEEVTNLVSGMKLEVAVQGSECKNDPETCLQESDIVYFLESRQESMATGGFQKLYPTREGDEYLPVVSRLSALSRRQKGRKSLKTKRASGQYLSELQIHSLLVNAERFYTSMAAEETEVAYDDVNIPVSQDENFSQSRKDGSLLDQQRAQECSRDKSHLPYLSGIHFSLSLKLSPVFQAVRSDYTAVVDYQTYLLKAWAVAKSCYCEARLWEKHGLDGPTNVTLGLGNNRITIFVVDLSHGDPWVINTYSVTIYRKGPAEGLLPFNWVNPHQVCSMKQDCSMNFSPKESCGLHRVKDFKQWPSFIQTVTKLPACQSGDVPGQWYVPCDTCKDGAVCYWDEARWQPQTCQHVTHSSNMVKSCFSGKKVLFIGDSTNRGILHYIAEVINGTLTEWDRTHDIKVYKNLNNGTTLLAFAYYPQFWLPGSSRPVFDDALYQLIKRTSPLSNSTDTVLVVGGVHWLSIHHVNVIKSKLQRMGLTGIKVIIKGLGSGFHLPVAGMRCLSKTEHQKLLYRNYLVTKSAKEKGFDVLETFNMTMSRYKDFLQGNCACHFHRVSPVHSKSHDKGSGRSEGHEGNSLSTPQEYHVEGEINAVFSEILINIICNSHFKNVNNSHR